MSTEGRAMKYVTVLVPVFLSLLASAPSADDGEKLLTIDHYVRVKSTVPAIAGQLAQIYVRERVQAGAARRAPPSSLSGGGAPPPPSLLGPLRPPHPAALSS